jgi:hypothetical protein
MTVRSSGSQEENRARLLVLERVMDELVEAYGDEDMPDKALDTLARLNAEWRKSAQSPLFAEVTG